MGRLLLLRHAKSSWDMPTLRDYERPLSARGQRACAVMGRLIADVVGLPDLIVCSGAVRTRATLERISAQWPSTPPVRFSDEIYEAEPQSILQALRREGMDAPSVMVIGHNPGLEDLSRALIATSDDEARRALETKFPTGALAVLEGAPSRWEELATNTLHLSAFYTPRALAKASS